RDRPILATLQGNAPARAVRARPPRSDRPDRRAPRANPSRGVDPGVGPYGASRPVDVDLALDVDGHRRVDVAAGQPRRLLKDVPRPFIATSSLLDHPSPSAMSVRARVSPRR